MDGEALERQYDRALAEYRFQVDLNWRRSEYFFVLNVGVLIAALTLVSADDVPRALVALLFGIGALLAGLSVLANETQHTYYRSARNLKQELEQRIELEELAIVTTQGMGSTLRQLGRVRTFMKIMLIAIGLVDLGGAAFVIDDAQSASDDAGEPPRAVLIHVATVDGTADSWSALVLSRAGEPARTRRLKGRSHSALFSLRPGEYRVALGGRILCERKIEIGHRPLQLVTLRC
jgi:hypothetical protein